ncbi:hypothetical protein NKH61_27755 [Mesorhizobium sp. M1005]|uniref:hypothetical protein n=1 Tax=unclassified Mesorhizobium TaxID=325217 RepID=UPI003339F161
MGRVNLYLWQVICDSAQKTPVRNDENLFRSFEKLEIDVGRITLLILEIGQIGDFSLIWPRRAAE